MARDPHTQLATRHIAGGRIGAGAAPGAGAVDGYQVGDPPPSRLVRGLRRADDAVRPAYARLTVFGDHTPVIAWWEPVSRWALLALAACGAVLLAGGHVVGAAVVVAARVTLAAVTAPPAPSATTWRRLIGYNPDWVSTVCSHAGNALVLAGLSAGLHAGGRPLWAAVTMGAALFGLLATVSRIAAREQGLRLPRLWIERAAKDLALTDPTPSSSAPATRSWSTSAGPVPGRRSSRTTRGASGPRLRVIRADGSR
jgi:hypothetical protein